MKIKKTILKEFEPALREYYWLISKERITEIGFVAGMSKRLKILLSKILDEQRGEIGEDIIEIIDKRIKNYEK